MKQKQTASWAFFFSLLSAVPAFADSDDKADEAYFQTKPVEQKGKEVQIFGPLIKTPPPEGHYECKQIDYDFDGKAQTRDQIANSSDYSAFDFFADGTAHVFNKKKNKFEDLTETWKHNPVSGALYFNKGILNVYLKFPIHVRKKLNATSPEISILYDMNYSYDGTLSDFTTCFNVGPPISKSPKAVIAEKAKKEMAPPPPGSKRIAGLYYHQKWVPMTSFTGIGQPMAMYQQDYYEYRYFQDNGYVWVGDPPEDGDFEKLGCNKPMTNEKGEATCTTYDISEGWFSKGTIRVGLEKPVPYAASPGGLTLDGDVYSLVKPQSHPRINKTVSYFHYNGTVSGEGFVEFKSNGNFRSSRFTGVFVSNQIGDTTTTVTGGNQSPEQNGTYDIDGYSITMKTADGKTAKKFFGYFEDGFFMIGVQPYIERGKN